MSNWKYILEYDIDEIVDMEAANKATKKSFGKTWKKNEKRNRDKIVVLRVLVFLISLAF